MYRQRNKRGHVTRRKRNNRNKQWHNVSMLNLKRGIRRRHKKSGPRLTSKYTGGKSSLFDKTFARFGLMPSKEKKFYKTSKRESGFKQFLFGDKKEYLGSQYYLKNEGWLSKGEIYGVTHKGAFIGEREDYDLYRKIDKIKK